MTYDFNLNRDEVIAGALRILGVISQGQTPDATQVSDAAEALNVLVKALEAEGLPVWAIKKQAITPVANQSAYVIGDGQAINIAKPLRIYQAYYHRADDGVDVPMMPLTQQQYNALTAKAQTGYSNQYYWEELNTYGNLYLWVTPDSTFAANCTVNIIYQAPFADFDADTDVPDFPQYWLRALKYGLADEMAMEYGYPIKDRQELAMRAEKYKDDALAFTQEEGSFFFAPDRMRM